MGKHKTRVETAVYRDLDQDLFDGILELSDLAGNLAAFVREDRAGYDGSGDTTSTSESHLGLD